MRAPSGRLIAIASLLTAILVLPGCAKEVELTFMNGTSQVRDVYLTAPPHGTMYLGVLPAKGGTLLYELEIDQDLLPANCYWEAGNRRGSFTVSEESADKMTITIDPAENVTTDGKVRVEKVDRAKADGITVEPKKEFME